MELVSSLYRWRSKSAAIAEKQITFASARGAMMVTYPELVQDAECVHVFSNW